MGLFELCEDQFGCSPTQTALVFIRATRDQDSAGQILLSFASAVTVHGDLQPEPGLYPRLLHGTLTEVHYTFIIPGNPDVRTGDRTTISAAPVEVVNVQHFGTEQAELALRYVR